jgi:phospholipase/carboxylesterase
MDRRTALKTSFALLGAGCGSPFSVPDDEEGDPRLQARPRTPTRSLPAGRSALGLGDARDGFVHVPTAPAGVSLPLLLLLHGAGSNAAYFTGLTALLDELRIVALAVESRGATWDVVYDDWGEDVEFIDRALAHVFERVPIDAARVGVGGFSDGASYALSLGLVNGDLFTDVFGWSPGFVNVPERRGRPAVLVSHGTGDQILPIDGTSRVIVPRLRDWGYTVRYEEFTGGHTLPGEISRLSLEQLAA